MAETQDNMPVKEVSSGDLAHFTQDEIDELYKLAANRVNEAMAKTLDKSGDMPVFVALAQKGTPFAKLLSEADPQLYTYMVSRAKKMEVDAKQMEGMLEVYRKKNLNDIGYREPRKTLLGRLSSSTLLGGFMGAVLGFFASQQIINNMGGKKDKSPAVQGNKAGEGKIKIPVKPLAIAVSTLLAAIAGFVLMEKTPLVSQRKKEKLHEEVSKLSLGELNERIHQMNGEIRKDHEGVLSDIQKAAVKATVVKMMKEAVSSRAETLKKAVKEEATGRAEDIDGQRNKVLEKLHGEGNEVVKETVTAGRAEPRQQVQPRSISPESVQEQRANSTGQAVGA